MHRTILHDVQRADDFTLWNYAHLYQCHDEVVGSSDFYALGQNLLSVSKQRG